MFGGLIFLGCREIGTMAQLQCGDKALDLSRTRVMGILNATPDSFSDGGKWYRGGSVDIDAVLHCASEMVGDGVDIIDVGGESTRPGAEKVTEEQELARVLPVVEAINGEFDVIISVDTSSPRVMAEAATIGAGLINDVRSLTRPGALEAAAATGLPVCLMHMPGEPDAMQSMTNYDAPITDVVSQFLMERVNAATQAGILRENLILDPGFGFGKTLSQNIDLFTALSEFEKFELPLLVGVSRKRMVGDITGKDVGSRLAGSLALAMLAAQSGAKILRVHDVAETVDALKVLHALEAHSL